MGWATWHGRHGCRGLDCSSKGSVFTAGGCCKAGEQHSQPLLTEDGIFAFFIIQECDWCQVVFLQANHGQANLGRGMKKSQDALTDPFE